LRAWYSLTQWITPSSAYAELRIMPTVLPDSLVSWLLAIPGSA
jgi:hypothetical protein